MDQILVGDEGCTYREVRIAIQNSGSAICLYKNLEALALELQVSDETRMHVKRDLSQNLTPPTVVLHDLLVSWRGSSSDNATLRTLIDSLENIGLAQLGEVLLQRFCGAKRTRISKYTCAPIDLQWFMDLTTNILILCTPNVPITYERLSEMSRINISALKSPNDFRFLSSNTSPNNIIIVQTNNVKQLLDKAKELKTKIIFITMENYEDLTFKCEGDIELEIKKENLRWSDLTTDYKNSLQSNCKYLQNIDNNLIEDTLKGDVLCKIIQNPALEFSDSTLPESITYYIPRRILPRSNISSEIFKTYTDHIFLFSGIERHKLSILTENKPTDNSSSQKSQPNITVNFILLDTKLDFETISDMTSLPVHWLHQENDTLTWVKSTGGMFEIQQFVDQSQTEFFETEFMDRRESEWLIDLSNTPVCISDTPGMGKTKLLANIGRRLADQGKIVVFIVIGEFLKTLKESWGKKKPMDISDSLIDVLCKQTTCNVEQSLLEMNLRCKCGKKHVELLFDGLDENRFDSLQLSYDCFQKIKGWTSSRLWITTRPHLLHTLEDNLNVLGYNIAPFKVHDQERFLVGYWLHQIPELISTKLEKYAQKCLDTLKENMHNKEKDIAGIPLQCLLIAVVFQDVATNYATANNSLHIEQYIPSIHIKSITDLFQKVIELKYKKYFDRYSNHAKQIKESDLHHAHMHLSLRLLFPKRVKSFKNFLKNYISVDELLNVGILESVTSIPIPRFIHRTFAEYFIAMLIVEILKLGRLKFYPSFFFEGILKNYPVKFQINLLTKWKVEVRTFRYKVICYFIDNMIQSMHLHETEIGFLQKRIQQKFKPDQLNNLVFALVYENHINIFRLLKENVNAYVTKILIYVAVNRCSLQFLKLLCDNCLSTQMVGLDVPEVLEMSEFLGFKTQNLSANLTTRIEKFNALCTPLDIAASRGSYDLMEYLITQQSYETFIKQANAKYLFHHILHNSKLEEDRILSDKFNIMNYLATINNTIVDYKFKGRTALLSKRVHLKLLKATIDLNADLLTTDRTGCTILHVASSYLSCEEYCSLFEMIPTAVLQKLVNMKSASGHTPLHDIVKRHEFNETVFHIFRNAGADFNSRNLENETIISTAVVSSRNMIFLKSLLEMGAVMDDKMEVSKPLIKVAILSDNFDAVKLCLEFCDVNEKYDNKRPLQIALKYRIPSFTIVRHLISVGAVMYETDLFLHQVFEVGSIDDINWAIDKAEFVNSIDNLGETPLHNLLSNNTRFPKMTAYFLLALLEKQADLHIKNKKGHCPLEESLECVEFTLDFDTLVILEKYGAINSEAVASKLIKNIVIKTETFEIERNFQIFISCVKQNAFISTNLKYELLYKAVKNKCTPGVKYLLLKGFDSRAKIIDFYAYSAFSLSVDKFGELEIDSALLKRGISEGEDVDSITLLKAACFYGSVDTIKVMYRISCFQMAFKDGDVLYVVVGRNSLEIVRLMCECYTKETGEAVLSLKYEGTSASLLHLALNKRHHETSKYLLESHLHDIHLKDTRMRDLVHVAVKSAWFWNNDIGKTILELLINRDPSLLEEKDADGKTPLFHRMKLDIMIYLVSKGANKHAVNNIGKTVLQTHEKYPLTKEFKAEIAKLLK